MQILSTVPTHKLDAAIRGLERLKAQNPGNELAPDLIAMITELKQRRQRDGESALAIGEHAFRAGYLAACDVTEYDVDKAWSEYDPPEDIKALA